MSDTLNAPGQEHSIPKTYDVMVPRNERIMAAMVAGFTLIIIIWFEFQSLYIGFLGLMLIMFAVLFVLLRLFKNFFTIPTLLKLYDYKLVIKQQEITEVDFWNIQVYNIYYGSGNAVTIYSAGGGKIVLSCNSNFGKVDSYEKFVSDFDSTMKQLADSNKYSIPRKRSFIESSFFVIILSVWTAVTVLTAWEKNNSGQRIPTMFLFYAAQLISAWALYLFTRFKNRN